MGFVVLLAVLEVRFPLRELRRSRRQRWPVNALLSTITYLSFWIAVSPATSLAVRVTQKRGWGLFQWLDWNATAESIFAFLILDLTFYYWHRLNHAVPVLWRFHNTHHFDPDMDVTTAFRFHAVEIFYSSAFRFIQGIVLGLDPLTAALYDLFFQAQVYFHHSNVRLPYRLEKVVHTLFVTPRFHSNHHAPIQTLTNSNFSVVLSFWDRLHSTQSAIVSKPGSVGIPGYDAPSDNHISSVLTAPFRRQKSYWG